MIDGKLQRLQFFSDILHFQLFNAFTWKASPACFHYLQASASFYVMIYFVERQLPQQFLTGKVFYSQNFIQNLHSIKEISNETHWTDPLDGPLTRSIQ